MLGLVFAAWVLLRPKADTLALGTSLSRDGAGLLLSGCLTNRYPLPVHLAECSWECEDDQGHVTNNLAAGRPIAQWTGVTNYRAPVPPTGPFNPALHTETLLPAGVAAISFRIPDNTRRARLFILYRYRSGFVGTVAAKVLPVPSLVRWPKTVRWLDRHGFLGYYTVVYEGKWISNEVASGRRDSVSANSWLSGPPPLSSFVMRLSNILPQRFELLTVCGLLTLCIATGCMPGKPGYMLETEAMCTRLKAVNARESVAGWAASEIQNHLPAASNRPASFISTNVPSWLNEVDRYSTPPPIHIAYELDPTNDNVSINSMTGRGSWGVLLGGPNYTPGTNWPDRLFYVVRCEPGLYAWHSRSDY